MIVLSRVSLQNIMYRTGQRLIGALIRRVVEMSTIHTTAYSMLEAPPLHRMSQCCHQWLHQVVFYLAVQQIATCWETTRQTCLKHPAEEYPLIWLRSDARMHRTPVQGIRESARPSKTYRKNNNSTSL
jgi:hypothetical protein